MDKYVPGIPYNISVDFSKESLVFSDVFPAKPTYSISADISALNVIDNRLYPQYFENGTTGISNGIYAQNTNDVTHCFVNIVMMNKKDIPPSVTNIYHKKIILKSQKALYS